MWIDQDLIIHFSEEFQELGEEPGTCYRWIKQSEGKNLILNKSFRPHADFLAKHAHKHGQVTKS